MKWAVLYTILGIFFVYLGASKSPIYYVAAFVTAFSAMIWLSREAKKHDHPEDVCGKCGHKFDAKKRMSVCHRCKYEVADLPLETIKKLRERFKNNPFRCPVVSCGRKLSKNIQGLGSICDCGYKELR